MLRLIVAADATTLACGDEPAADVLGATADDLTLLAAACAATPYAVTVLAQLLRATSTIDVGSALVAESAAYSMLLESAEYAQWRANETRRIHRDVADPVHVADDGSVLTITLNRPEVHNVYDATTCDALVDQLRASLAIRGQRSVLLRGAGPSFCSGGDLSEFGVGGDRAGAHLVRTARSPGWLLHQLAPDTAALMHGDCIGAGVELPAFCERVEADADTRLSLPEVSMGLIPGAGGTVSVTRRIGRHRAALLAITGRVIDADTALEYGLVDRIRDRE